MTRAAPDLEALTGVRSGKGSYYRAFVRSDERMERAVRAMDSISRALVRTHEGPRGLLEEVVRAASAHLEAEWTILALTDGQLVGARPRFLALAGGRSSPHDEVDALPELVRRELTAIRKGASVVSADAGRWVRVPVVLAGTPVGALVGVHGLAEAPEPGDLAVLRILANQAAVSLYTSEQYLQGQRLHRRAQRLYDEVQAQSRDLAHRTHQLHRLEKRLDLARQRELIDGERGRIARELHDSVTQYVLSAGMVVELARGELAQRAGPEDPVHEQLVTAKGLTQQAVSQLRRAIYALSRSQGETLASLPDLVREVAEHHRSHLHVQFRVAGEPVALGVDAEHDIARAVGEAMFNVALHAGATRAVVHLRYRPDEMVVSVADDGVGDPVVLGRLLRVERRSTDGSHRGLANIEARVADLGGRVRFRRARIGGVRVEIRVPVSVADGRSSLIEQLATGEATSKEQR